MNRINSAKTMGLTARFSKLLVLLAILFSSCLKEDINTAEGVPSDYMSILDVKTLYKGTDIVLSRENMFGASKITGVVISDELAGNIPKGYLVLQQTSRFRTRGVVLNFGANTTIPFKLGDSLTIKVEGTTLGRRNGVLQINGASLSEISKNAEQVFYEPTQITLKELKNNFDNYESTLVKVAHVDALTPNVPVAGENEIRELVGEKATLHVESTATFADKVLPINASYVGIPLWNNVTAEGTEGAKQFLWLRNLAGVSDESGALYPNFPETFEDGDAVMYASGYAATKNGNLKTGLYTLTNAFLGGEANDRAISGKYSLRLNQNSTTDSWCTMNFDLDYGASKITLWAGSYGASADLGSTWRVEYSQDGGSIWYQLGQDILTVSKDKKQFTFLTSIKGKVRFRIGKVGVGASTTNNQNGRFNMDDFAVYRNPTDDGTGVIVHPTYSDLFSWQFGSPISVGNEAASNATFAVTGITTPVLTRGFGVNASTIGGGFGSNAKDVLENGNPAQLISTKAIAISQKAYFQIVFNTLPSRTVSLSAIDLKIRRSGAGGRNHAWYYSINDTEFKPTGAGALFYEGTGTGQDMPTNYIYNTPELQNLPGGTKITLRMYIWGITNFNSGSFAIGLNANGNTTPVLRVGGKIIP
ncbi:DUF5689 domain-containing protein [Pedobacter xixiisoli]|uniref:DUF5689 domain-containing protein n=1 Tax=Pedobacter xixiisoli TaxID=1476464 RepID=A0A286A8U6_9SPHI|nr:DUF5689 domain-containing protein [Pedobacter xixiisoli]SOD18302.1 hypothetical protein SAMN06297358_2931 [Pedobacter xixiisoli]